MVHHESPLVLELPAALTALRPAREATARLAEGSDGSELALIVDELVTNAVDHADSAPLLVLFRTGNVVRVEVSDNDPGMPVLQPSDPWDTSGRGLFLVATLADNWGTVFHEDGPLTKTVWAEVTLHP